MGEEADKVSGKRLKLTHRQKCIKRRKINSVDEPEMVYSKHAEEFILHHKSALLRSLTYDPV